MFDYTPPLGLWYFLVCFSSSNSAHQGERGILGPADPPALSREATAAR